MKPPPPGEEGLHIVKPNVHPRLLQTAVSSVPMSPVVQKTRRPFAWVIGILLMLTVLGTGAWYWMQQKREPVVVTIGVPEKPPPVDPETNVRQSLIPVTPDMLYVSSIALGKPNLAIVNGRELTEGDWLAVPTRLGNASIQLTQIEDGMVRFRHGGQTITAKLQAGARKTP